MTYYTSSGTGYEASVRNCHISVFLLSNYYSATLDTATDSYNADTNYQDIMTYEPDILATGDYLVLASASQTGNTTGDNHYLQLLSGDSQGEVSKEPTVASQFRPYMIMRVINYDTVGVKTLTLQHKTDKTSLTVSTKNKVITLVKLSDLGIHVYSADVAGSSTSSDTYELVTGASISGTPSQAGEYLVTVWSTLSNDATNRDVYSHLFIDDMGHGEIYYRSDSNLDAIPVFDQHIALYTSAAHTAGIYHKATSPATVTTSNARLLAIQINTLESYQDAGVTPQSTFDATNHIVYIYGYGHEYDYEAETPAGRAYTIAFYDDDDIKVTSVATTSAYNRSINASYELNGSLGAPGTWHAVVYRDILDICGVADSGSTTTLVDNARTEANDYWNGWTLDMLTGAAAAETPQVVTGFNATTISISGFTGAIATGDTYRLYKDVSAPVDYSPNDPDSLMELEFTVAGSAIPEFPTAVAAVVTSGMCFSIYYWMRKRRLARVKA